jgi:hypothetical protein
MLGAEGVSHLLRDFAQMAPLKLPLLDSDDLVHQCIAHHGHSGCA